jgi:flagellin
MPKKGQDAARIEPAAASKETQNKEARPRERSANPCINKENPMSLGVLNNLSAIYAANNINKTSTSLSTVLQQLSSGSKINSGADDAAGLSLVNGLQANSTALSQSKTNATEGVGLLTVADGALSQVTSLLNRAVTLATEASNGTLNSTQDTAANEEYQSILSEISNIGSTTTYNDEKVFGSKTDIYTGDSTLAGSSINSLNIASLSSASVGDTNGVMSYDSGGGSSSSVFIDLKATSSSDALASGASITVNTLSSTGTTVSTTIKTGGNTGYANTVDGMVDAINNSGLGITASYTTGAVAEGSSTATDAADYGIQITGSVGTSTNLSTSSDSGTLTAVAANTDTLTGSITFQTGTGATTTISMADVAKSQGSATETTLAAYINADTALGVTADASSTTLKLSSTATSDALNVTSNLTDSTTSTAISYTATAAHSVGIGTVTITDSASSTTAATTAETGKTSTSSGIATISYSDSTGTDLSGTDLTNQTDAESALISLNKAISNVAAQDGYIGAQINTLNSVSSVLSTQSENVISAQDAVQATDYSTATSEMSKYEILSQTGIAALSQANSVQQEVTKLLQ